MPSSSYDSSSSDEGSDSYCNAAARLKALKSRCNDKAKAPAPPVDSKTTSGSQRQEGKNEKCPSAAKVSTTPEEISSEDDDAECVSNSSCSRDTVKLTESNGVTTQIVDTPIKVSDGCIEIADSPEVVHEDSFSEILTVDVYIRWKSNNIECLQLNKHEPLMKIFQYFADQENIPVNRILVSRKEAPIKPTDTPASLRLSILDVLEGGVISADASKTHETEAEDDPDVCKIKAQISSKKSLTFHLKKQEPFKKLAEYCAKELDVPIEKLRLYFDGDHIGDDETPEDLDLDDAACIDVKVL